MFDFSIESRIVGMTRARNTALIEYLCCVYLEFIVFHWIMTENSIFEFLFIAIMLKTPISDYIMDNISGSKASKITFWAKLTLKKIKEKKYFIQHLPEIFNLWCVYLFQILPSLHLFCLWMLIWNSALISTECRHVLIKISKVFL